MPGRKENKGQVKKEGEIRDRSKTGNKGQVKKRRMRG
jgi:hypothetical protein